MKELPILFSGPMVRATLREENPKTQTRRGCKQAHAGGGCAYAVHKDGSGTGWIAWFGKGMATSEDTARLYPGDDGFKCPYGKPGDRLWVRETFFAYGRWVTRFSAKKGRDEWHFIDMTVECDRAYQYAADNPEIPLAKDRGPLPGWYRRPAIHMPRRASRTNLEITGVRVERLQDISEADALAEGVEPIPFTGENAGPNRYSINMGGYWLNAPTAAGAYRMLWESINGPGSWEANPWVWVVEFRRLP